jgi:hypothetical protein
MVIKNDSRSELIYIYREGDDYVAISYSTELEAWIMHVDLKKWSVSEYKRYLKVFKVIKEELGKLTPYVLSLCRTKKEFKFNKCFGFKDTGLVAIDPTGELSRIARLELWER